jgi:hypothetical protein
MPTLPRRVSLFLLLAIGLTLWWCARDLETNSLPPLIAAAIVGGVCLLPPVAGFVDRLVDRARTPRRPVTLSFVVTIFAGVILYAVALYRDRLFFPILHDEFMYLLQARMLAQGRLWMPAHPMADFFETFFVIVRPVYASVYFPGTALINVPGIWLHLPEWLIPLIVSATAAGMLCWIVIELCGDALAGVLAALLLVSTATFRTSSIMVMSHPTMMLLGEAMIIAWLRWRRRHSLSWAAAIGGLAGLAAITRPLDALAFAAAIGLAMLLDLRPRPARIWLINVAVVILSAAPFLLLQLLFNLGVTGKVLETPYQLYLSQEQPQSAFSLANPPFDPSEMPQSTVPEKRGYYTEFLAPQIARYKQLGRIRAWFDGRLTQVAGAIVPHPALLALLPLSIIGLCTRGRWVLWITAPLLLLLYSFNPVFLTWYALTWSPAVILAVLLGMERLSQAMPRGGRAALFAAVATISLWSLVQPPADAGENQRSKIIETVHAFETSPHAPRVLLLFTLPEPMNFHMTPIYTIGAAWPDDAAVIHARSLGRQRDVELIRYYAEHQPDRDVITVDLAGSDAHDWGPASEALNHWLNQGEHGSSH